MAGWQWQGMAGYGWRWLALADHGGPWLANPIIGLPITLPGSAPWPTMAGGGLGPVPNSLASHGGPWLANMLAYVIVAGHNWPYLASSDLAINLSGPKPLFVPLFGLFV